MRTAKTARTGVWVTGVPRSGTSMTCGVLAEHGVFFGRCMDPNEYNAKGYFENMWLRWALKEKQMGDWPDSWFRQLAAEGLNGEPWGTKQWPSTWRYMKKLEPDVILYCRRPLEQIVDSMNRVPWTRMDPETRVKQLWQHMNTVRAEAECPVLEVETDELVRGHVEQLAPVLDALGLSLDPELAESWIDPSLWHG